MEDSYLEAQEHVASSNYEREVKETVTLFRDIKEDLVRNYLTFILVAKALSSKE